MLRPYGTASTSNSVFPVPKLAVEAPGKRRWKELSDLLSELQVDALTAIIEYAMIFRKH